MRLSPATELLPLPDQGRRFSSTRPVRLSDVDPRLSVRLDATARYLQDVATDDANDCGLDNAFGWVVRRTMIEIRRPARMGERLDLTTFCTGSGRSWAERRTSITGDGGGWIEAVSLWVQVDLSTGRPAPLGESFHEIYGEAAGQRQVSTRLSLPGPPDDVIRRAWSVRRVDLDPFDHVNNAVHWAAIEEFVGMPGTDRRGRAETEFAVPIDLDTPVELHVAESSSDHSDVWLVAAGKVRTTIRWTPAPPTANA